MSSKRKSEPMYDDMQEDFYSDDDAVMPRKDASKPGESVVTKRTLQNRKAQREFRKRREARVRDLEERCRRFDQMGLEANIELQRVARNLKEENEALRGFVIRIGYGNMMPNILDGVGHNNANMDNAFQPAFVGGFGGSAVESSKGSEEDVNDAGIFLPQSSPNDHQRSKGALPQSSFSDNMAGTQWVNNSNNNQNYVADSKKKSRSEEKQSTSPSSSSSSQNGPLLSLNLHRPGKQQEQQRQPDFTTSQNEESTRQSRMLPASLSPNTAMNNLLGQMNNQMSGNADGSGMTGSAMLGGYQSAHNNYAPYTVPQRTHQNEALLNPNPIPFAFNLSNEPTSANPSWWEQMGGGRFTPGRDIADLDEKAQAVAAAQANNGGPQSPFDLSAFLQGGVTPGGGYNLGATNSQDGFFKDKDKGASTSGSNDFKDTDHMRMFVQLLEKKVAEREAHTVASLGFQPPSQDPSKRQNGRYNDGDVKPKITFSSALSPTGVYSRLAEHPAFLSTDARELEELVDALGNGASRSPSETGGDVNSRRNTLTERVHLSSPKQSLQMSSSSINSKRSPSQNSASGSSNATAHHPHQPTPRDSHRSSSSSSGSIVEVDERAIDRLLGLLDQKRNARGMGEMGNRQQLSMAMT